MDLIFKRKVNTENYGVQYIVWICHDIIVNQKIKTWTLPE